MAFIEYEPEERIPDEDRVADRDNILRVHGVHSSVMIGTWEPLQPYIWVTDTVKALRRGLS